LASIVHDSRTAAFIPSDAGIVVVRGCSSALHGLPEQFLAFIGVESLNMAVRKLDRSFEDYSFEESILHKYLWHSIPINFNRLEPITIRQSKLASSPS
jgi:hypothetical protein